MDNETTAKPGQFDLRVTHRDPQTGAVTHSNPYKCHVIKAENGGKTQLFERPHGSKNVFTGAGIPCGRYVDGIWDEQAEHITYIPPETADQRVIKTLSENAKKIEQLEKELAAIKAEAKPDETHREKKRF